MSALPLPVALKYLNITGSGYDTKVQAVIDAAEVAIAKRCGPLVPTSTTVRVRGGGTALVLKKTPALTLTSVTPVDGTAVPLSQVWVSEGGLVRFSSGGSFAARWYDVVYDAGRATVPADLLMAVKELVRHMWHTQRGPTRRPGSEPSESTANTVPGAAYMLPNRVLEMIGPYEQKGFA